MAQWLSDLWKNLHTSDVWVDWSWGGKAKGITMEGGAVDNSPLLEYLQGIASEFSEAARRFVISTVNVNTGEYTQFTEKDLTIAEVAEASFSSASIPFVFPPNQWDGKGVFMDGGTVYNINAEGVIASCMDGIVDDESKIILDIVLCSNHDMPAEDDVGKVIGNYQRGKNIRGFYSSSDTLAFTMKGHPNINYRYILHESSAMGGFSQLNFEGDYTWSAQEQGRQDAVDALAGANQANLREYFQEWLMNEDELRSEHKHVGKYITERKAEDHTAKVFVDNIFDMILN